MTHSLSSSDWTRCFIKHPEVFDKMYRATFEISPRNPLKVVLFILSPDPSLTSLITRGRIRRLGSRFHPTDSPAGSSRCYSSRSTRPRPRRFVCSHPYECLFTSFSAFRTLSTAGARIARISGIGVYLGFLLGLGAGQADHRCMHVVVVNVPSPYSFLPNLTLLEVSTSTYPPYYRSSSVHAHCRGVYYSRCSLCITLHASHTLDRVPRPLIWNGRQSRPVVPHQLLFFLFEIIIRF